MTYWFYIAGWLSGFVFFKNLDLVKVNSGDSYITQREQRWADPELFPSPTPPSPPRSALSEFPYERNHLEWLSISDV